LVNKSADPLDFINNIVTYKNIYDNSMYSYNPKVVSSSLTPATTEKSHFRWKIGAFINFKVIHLSTLKTVKNH